MRGDDCKVTDCDRTLTGRGEGHGMCSKHYNRWQHHGHTDKIRVRNVCSIEGCGKPCVGRGWCSKHWTRWDRYGDPEARMAGEIRDGKKVCSQCREDKTLAEFPLRGDSWCLACQAAIMRARRDVRPTYIPVVRTPAVCDCCGAEFLADKRRWRYCSPGCFETYRHIANAPHRHARRARLAGAESERFERDEVFNRDGWVCQLCDEPIDAAIKYPDPMSPSLDHILPIARGGAHTRANAQASHLVCNLRKHTKTAVA